MANNGNNYQTADNLKWNWKKTYLYANSTTQRCPREIIKKFQIEDFFHLPPVSLTPVTNLELRISPRVFEKIWNGSNGIIRGWGKLFMKKTRSKKSRDTVPLRQIPSNVTRYASNWWNIQYCKFSYPDLLLDRQSIKINRGRIRQRVGESPSSAWVTAHCTVHIAKLFTFIYVPAAYIM